MNQLALIGLGRMGGNMARRLARAGIAVAVHNRTYDVARQLAAEEVHAEAYERFEDMLASLARPRIVWLMLPAGAATDGALDQLVPLLDEGDLVVNGANAYYRDSVAQAARLAEKGIDFIDAGVSGGVWGLANGYALMLGGSAQGIARLKPVIEALAPAADQGWVHCGPVGSGHYAKMVHNGIEYGMMQALAEGFALLEAKREFAFDLAAVGEAWRVGSVVRSWLLDLTVSALAKDPRLQSIEPYVADSGEGRWTVLEAVEQGVPAPVITDALYARFSSQGRADFGNKLLAMMRKGFGGHAVKQEGGHE